MADIFLSYSKADLERVTPIVKLLENAGWSVWWDTALAAGEHWPKTIKKEIDKARAVVVVWTTSSIEKHWVYSEASSGMARGILVPILFDDVTPPMPFDQIQATNMTRWRPGDDTMSARLLEKAVHQVFGDSTKPPKPGETEKWAAMKNSRVAARFQEFLAAFPDGRYAETAALRVQQLSLAPHEDRGPATPKWTYALAALAFALIGIWYFGGLGGSKQIVVPPKPTLADVGHVWEHVRGLEDLQVFEAFEKDFADFPTYVQAAKARIAELKQKVAATQPPPVEPAKPAANPVALNLPWTFANKSSPPGCWLWTSQATCKLQQGCSWTPWMTGPEGNGTCSSSSGLFGNRFSIDAPCATRSSRSRCEFSESCTWDAFAPGGPSCRAKLNLNPPVFDTSPAGTGKSTVCATWTSRLSCTLAEGCEWDTSPVEGSPVCRPVLVFKTAPAANAPAANAPSAK